MPEATSSEQRQCSVASYLLRACQLHSSSSENPFQESAADREWLPATPVAIWSFRRS